MHSRHGFSLAGLILLFVFASPAASAVPQEPAVATATLRAISVEGLQHLSEAQVVSLAAIPVGSPVSKPDLQAAADRLLQTGLFASVNYTFQERSDGLYLTFKLSETPRVPAFFDNLPWFSDSELTGSIRNVLPFYDGTLPEAGAAVEQATTAISALLAAHGVHTAVEHQLIANPLGEGSVQEFRIADSAPLIAKLEFADPALAASRVLQQHLGEIEGKPYSRMAIDLFLAEQVRPIYLQQGLLSVKLGPPEVRLSGNPSQKLPDRVSVFVPVTAGPVYHWKGAQFTGNNLLSVFTLTNAIGLKSGQVADGQALEAAWARAEDEYARNGYLDAKIAPSAAFDEQAHTVFYRVVIQEGRQYKFGKLVLTGISAAAERHLRAAWPNLAGEPFDKLKYEEILDKLQTHREQIFIDLPIHYDSVGHWLEKNSETGIVDALLDFK
jgi:outer membrane protein assembly factor BamA